MVSSAAAVPRAERRQRYWPWSSPSPKGYDLGYIWKTQDRTAERGTGGYYLNAAQADPRTGARLGRLDVPHRGLSGSSELAYNLDAPAAPRVVWDSRPTQAHVQAGRGACLAGSGLDKITDLVD